jgi:hypothetical protein
MLLLFFSLLVYKSKCDEKDILIYHFVFKENQHLNFEKEVQNENEKLKYIISAK